MRVCDKHETRTAGTHVLQLVQLDTSLAENKRVDLCPDHAAQIWSLITNFEAPSRLDKLDAAGGGQ